MNGQAPSGYVLFRTAVGECGLAWRGGEVTAVKLPERDVSATERSLRRSAPGAVRTEPPGFVADAMRKIIHHLAGNPQDMSAVPLALSSTPPFHRKVYAALRRVPAGETVSYANLAAKAGSRSAARAVGQAMAKNPFPIVVPCHRVLAANGAPGGFSAYGALGTKKKLLEIEGARLGPPGPQLSLLDEPSTVSAIRTVPPRPRALSRT